MAKKQKKKSDKQKLREFFQTFLSGRRTAQPVCRHFGDCGGCEFQDVPYPDQLLAKREAFSFVLNEVITGFREKAEAAEEETTKTLLEKAARSEEAFSTIQPSIVASPQPLGYRQRMDYVFAFGKAGLRRINRHRQVVELEECPLLGEKGFSVVQRARKMADEAGLESYDYLHHTGELRYFVIRQSRSGEILLSLVTKTEDCQDKILALLGKLVEDNAIQSGYWLIAPGLGDVSFGREAAHVGNAFITETMNAIRLGIGPNTFFQSNPSVAEKAYAVLRDFVPSGSQVLDLYSGVGSIALTTAANAGTVTAVECVPENIALAEQNLKANQIENVTLLVDDSRRYLSERSVDTSAQPVDFMAINPPRPGVEGDGMLSIKHLSPHRLAYLSCNPFTLFSNLSDILDKYRIESAYIYDMFPQTRHFECLVLMSRRDSAYYKS